MHYSHAVRITYNFVSLFVRCPKRFRCSFLNWLTYTIFSDKVLFE